MIVAQKQLLFADKLASLGQIAVGLADQLLILRRLDAQYFPTWLAAHSSISGKDAGLSISIIVMCHGS